MAATKETRQAHLRLETRQAHVKLETRQAQLKLLKKMRYHPGSKFGSFVRLMEVILWIGNMPAIQGTRQADERQETRQAHLRLGTRQAHSNQNSKGDVIPPMQPIW